MNKKGILIAEVAMLFGLVIAIVGGVAILIVSEREPMAGVVIWGIGSAVLIFTAGRRAIGLLKDEIQQSPGGSDSTNTPP